LQVSLFAVQFEETIRETFKKIRTKRLRSTADEVTTNSATSSISKGSQSNAVKSLRFKTDHDSTTCTYSLSFGQQQASSLSFGQQQAAYPVSTAIPLETHRHAYVYDTLNTAQVVNNCSYVNPPIFETDDCYSLILPTSSSFNFTSTSRESESSVKLSVDYPSKTVNKTLKNEYEISSWKIYKDICFVFNKLGYSFPLIRIQII
jgi:hypothetical protein